MLMYWLVSDSDLRQAALPAHTIASMRQKELPKPEFKPNRASRKHLEKNYGKAVPQWTWKPRMTAKTGAAIADLVNGIARAGNDWATRYGLGQKIQAQEPNVRKILQQHPDAGGVLIVAKYQEWEMKDFTGAKAKTALSAAVAGWGATPIEAYRNWDQLNATHGVISAGAPRGWVVHELYFWAVLR